MEDLFDKLELELYPSGIENKGDLTVNGGEISGSIYGIASVSADDPSKITVNGGTISSSIEKQDYDEMTAIFGDEADSLSPMIGEGILLAGSKTNITGGEITGLSYGLSVGTASGVKDDPLNITGGNISSIYFYGHDFNLSGAPVITEKIHLVSSSKITINGELTGSGTYPIEMDTPGVFTTGANDFPDAVKHFSSFDPDHAVVENSDGELELAEIHRHDDGMEFLPWDKTDSLPTESGKYYL